MLKIYYFLLSALLILSCSTNKNKQYNSDKIIVDVLANCSKSSVYDLQDIVSESELNSINYPNDTLIQTLYNNILILLKHNDELNKQLLKKGQFDIAFDKYTKNVIKILPKIESNATWGNDKKQLKELVSKYHLLDNSENKIIEETIRCKVNGIFKIVVTAEFIKIGVCPQTTARLSLSEARLKCNN